MNLKKFSLIAISITGLSLGLHAASALPNDISGLVDSAAPAVVNITSKKEVKMRDNRRGFDEFERFFGILTGLTLVCAYYFYTSLCGILKHNRNQNI